MPPPLEELESDDEDLGDIPHGGPEAESEDSEENGEEEEEGLYVVEDILDHQFVKGELELLVKWKGYEEPEDQTFEPEEGLLEGAHDIVAEYYKRIGGRPKPPPKPAKGSARKRKSMTDPKPAPSLVSPLSPVKRRRRSPKEAAEGAKKEEGSEESDLNWVPKAKNWEKQVDSVDTIVRDPETDTLFAFLKWTNGKQTKVSIQSCYDNCPQKMLKFYESHLVFKDETKDAKNDEQNRDDEMEGNAEANANAMET